MVGSSVRSPKFTFLWKIVAGALLVAGADMLFFVQAAPAPLGAFALLWAVLLGGAAPALLHNRNAILALAAAGLFGLVLIDDPNPLACLLFLTAISLAALLPRVARFGSALAWAPRLVLHGMSSPFAPLADLARLQRAGRRSGRFRPGAAVALLALPIAGGALFLLLFSAANPLIERAIEAVRPPSFGAELLLRILLWAGVMVLTWTSFRPRPFVTRALTGWEERDIPLPNLPTTTVTLSLLVFNAIFLVQNLLDILFLWSGAPLPEGVTLAEYAHRGAYPLILTALLAALFVLVVFRPGSETAARPLIRRLVVLWIGQNLLLVASSILRTLDYIDVFLLTELRIAALAWMVLVALGLVLICWRLLKGKSSRWLINTNAAAAALVLTLASILDLGAAAAAWNVSHAREVGGRGAPLDLCYLRRLGPSSLLPLIQLERRLEEGAFRDRVRAVRLATMTQLEEDQADPPNWSWRGARRLAEARRLSARLPAQLRDAPFGRDCNGSLASPPAPPPPPLTAEPGR